MTTTPWYMMRTPKPSRAQIARYKREEAEAEALIQSDPNFGLAFLSMTRDELVASIANPSGHPSLIRKAERIYRERFGGEG